MTQARDNERIMVELHTQLVVQETFQGDVAVVPLAELDKMHFGSDEREGLETMRLFLEEHLGQVSPQTLANYSLPEGTRLVEVRVELEREDLPRRFKHKALSFDIACALIPLGKATWARLLPLKHTFYIGPGEDEAEAIDAEFKRVFWALEPTPATYLDMAPPRRVALEPMSVQVCLSDTQPPPGRAMSVRRALIRRQKAREARAVLESIGRPLHTKLSGHGDPKLVGREALSEALGAVLDGPTRMGVLLIGPQGAGKSALWRSWLRGRAGSGEGAPAVYATSGAQLIAGMSGLGQWQARVRRVMEAAEVLDAVLVLEDLRDMFSSQGDSSVDLPGALKPWLEAGRVRMIAELTDDALDALESRHVGFFGALTRLVVEPLGRAETLDALKHLRAHSARVHPKRANLRPESVRPLVELCDRYLPYLAFPGKAVRLFEELQNVHDGRRGSQDLAPEIRPVDVFEAFAVKTGIPAFLLRDDKPLKLKAITKTLGERLIGQRDAVERVAQALCVVKARLQPGDKPLATLFFVGPTGVGKTELARTLARFLFGTEERLIRFDMSEYTDVEAADRLLYGSQHAEGALTRKVRQQPFSVVLLDEIEKAHPAVFDLLLQVCGEGRLTDARGRTAHFHNTLVILTSNLGVSAAKARPVGLSAQTEAPRQRYEAELERTFRPEFLNRIDRVVVFEALTQAEIQAVTAVQIGLVQRRRGFAERGVTLNVSPPALAQLAAGGYSAAYGARALGRHLERCVITPAAYALSGLGDRARGGRVDVTLPDEDTPSGAIYTQTRDGVRVSVYGPPPRSLSRELHSATDISDERRRLHRWMRIDRVAQIRDQLDMIVAQLNTSARAAKRDPRIRAECSRLQTEHHRLDSLMGDAAGLVEELEAVEELALMALFEGEEVWTMLGEAQRISARFRAKLVFLLTALDPHHNAITLRVHESDGAGALGHWLLPLIDRLPDLSWRLTAHVHGDPGFGSGGEEEWPKERPYGPARSAAWLAERLQIPDRPATSALLCLRGPNVANLLAPEVGLHRWDLPIQDRPLHLRIALMAFKDALTPKQWGSKLIHPPEHVPFEDLERMPTARSCDRYQITLWGSSEHAIERGRKPYADHLEDIALTQYLAYEDGSAPRAMPSRNALLYEELSKLTDETE